MTTKKIQPGKIIMGIVMIGVSVMVLYPLIWLIISSFKLEREIVQFPPSLWPSALTVEHYIRVWDVLPLFRLFMNTIFFSSAVTIANVLLAAMAGYAFARIKFKGRDTMFKTLLLTMMVPFHVIMIPLYILIHSLGMLDTFAGLIIPRLTWPFAIYLMRAFFVALPKNLEEAGRIDGASEYRIFWSVMLPLCKPALITIGVMTFVNNWNDLLYPLLVTNSSNMRTLAAGLAMFVGLRIIEYGPTLAAAMISLIPLFVIFIFLQKYFVRGTVISGMK